MIKVIHTVRNKMEISYLKKIISIFGYKYTETHICLTLITLFPSLGMYNKPTVSVSYKIIKITVWHTCRAGLSFKDPCINGPQSSIFSQNFVFYEVQLSSISGFWN